MKELAQVHDAIASDEDGIFALLVIMHEEQGALFALDEPKVRAAIRRCIARDRAICGVIRVDGKPVGAIGIVVESYWWTSDDCLVERFNFVHPDHRRSNYALSQIEYAKRCSDALKELHIPLVIGVFDGGRDGNGANRTDAKLRFYRRSMKPAGAFFSHNMDWVEHVR